MRLTPSPCHRSNPVGGHWRNIPATCTSTRCRCCDCHELAVEYAFFSFFRSSVIDILIPALHLDFLVGFFSSKIAADIGPLILLIFAGVLVFGCVYIYLM